MPRQKTAKRRFSREWAMQMLFRLEANPADSLDEAFADFWELVEAAPDPFAERLVRGVLEHRDEIDMTIEKHARNWTVQRMPAVDRNVIRVAVYELLFDEPKTDAGIIINEAIDIVKYFDSLESGKFVNAILDKCAHAEK